jgi:hypothetical protein
MKRKILTIAMLGAIGIMSSVGIASASTSDFGAAGAKAQDSYTLPEMLTYAIQDEYLAKTEYQKIMDTFGVQRPFSNIIKAEDNHISELQPLFTQYDVPLPADTASDYVVIPSTLQDAYKAGVEAEINNIAMYEAFLEQDLPYDVNAIFENLKTASEKHLQAFERGVSRPVIASTGKSGRIQGQNQGQFRNRR